MKVSSCVGCGFCCMKAPCWLAKQFPCNELTWDKEKKRYICNLVVNDIDKANELYIGEGCCMGLNTWRQNVIPRRKKDE